MLESNEQAAYDDLNRFLAGLVRRQAASKGGGPGTGESAASGKGGAVESRRRGRGWSVKVLGVSRLRDVVDLCQALEAVPCVRSVRVTGLSADHIHLALATGSSIDTQAVETILASLSLTFSDETSFEVEESSRSGSRFTACR